MPDGNTLGTFALLTSSSGWVATAVDRYHGASPTLRADLFDANESTWAFAAIDGVGHDVNWHVTALTALARKDDCGRTADGADNLFVRREKTLAGFQAVRRNAGAPPTTPIGMLRLVRGSTTTSFLDGGLLGPAIEQRSDVVRVLRVAGAQDRSGGIELCARSFRQAV